MVMGVGLQVFGESGEIKLDLTKRLPKVIGTKEITGSGEIRFDQYPGMKPWYLTDGGFDAAEEGKTPFLKIDNINRRIIWGDLGNKTRSILYGVY